MITIQNLCKKFEDKVLFDNFNCSIPDSGFVVFCGESGCGKTTLQLISEHQDEINELIGIAGKNIDINITQV